MLTMLQRKAPRRAASCLALCALLSLNQIASAQNVVVNGDFSEGETGWTIYQMQPEGTTPGEVFFDDTEECPTGGSPGGCAFMFGTGTLEQVEVLLFQEITLIAGTPYVVDAQFRYLAETAIQNWSELYLGDVAPANYQNWTGFSHWSFNAYEGCSGLGVDGKFSEHACQGRQTLEFLPPGDPGTELTYYVGVKSGMWQGEHFALAIDDVTVAETGGAFAVAEFTTEPSSRVLLGTPITFDASGTSASGNVTSYAWDFGDGNTGSGEVVEHTYAEFGQYPVQLVVTTDDGAADTVSHAVLVWEGVGLPDNPLEIPQAPSVPAIDGEKDRAWDGAKQITVATHTNNAPPEDPEDLTVDAWVMWDPENFYIFFDVVDDTLINDSESTWQDDAPEFYLDGGNEKDSLYDENDQAWELGWNDEAVSGRGISSAAGAALATIANSAGDGYTVEAMMPWSNIGVAPQMGDTIGFEAAINDDDIGQGTRDTKLAWFSEPGNDNAWQWSYIWGNAVLVDEISTAAEPAEGVPGTFALEGVYPNPFNPSATARLSVHEPGAYTMRLFNVLGQLVEERALAADAPGVLQVPFDLAGRASGTYLLWVQHVASGRIVTAKAMLLK